jgi:hypothetical protein
VKKVRLGCLVRPCVHVGTGRVNVYGWTSGMLLSVSYADDSILGPLIPKGLECASVAIHTVAAIWLRAGRSRTCRYEGQTERLCGRTWPHRMPHAASNILHSTHGTIGWLARGWAAHHR